MVRKLMSDAEEAALDLRERCEDLLDSGTRVQEDGDGLLTWPPLFAGLVVFRSRGSQRGALSSLLSAREGTLGTGRECAWQRRGRSGSAGPAVAGRSSRVCFLRWWCRCVGLDVLECSLTPRPASPFGSGGSGPCLCGACDLHLPRVAALLPPSWLPTRDGWHRGLRALTSLSADQKDPSALGRW